MVPSNTRAVRIDTPEGREMHETFLSTSAMMDLSMSRLFISTMQIIP